MRRVTYFIMALTNGTNQILFILHEYWGTVSLLVVIFFIYCYFTRTFNYFKERGIKYNTPVILFGNMWPHFAGKESIQDFQLKIYNSFKDQRYVGVFEGLQPMLYITDPDLTKAITIRDFDHFVNRRTLTTREPRYIKRCILNLKDAEWKSVRSILTPSFSPFRLKNMLPLMQESSHKLLMYLDNIDCSAIEMKKLTGYYTLDVIGSCAFGIDSCFHKDVNSEYIKAAEDYNKIPFMKRCLVLVLTFMPELFQKFINISFLNEESIKVLISILQKAKAEKRSSYTPRSDFLQLLIDASRKEQEEENGPIEMDEDTIDAQALLFLLAGYESSSTLFSFVINVLITLPDIQDKLRQHIAEVTKGEDITYEHLAELDYLEAVLLETCRIYPPFARIDRVCVKPYTMPGSSIRLEAGDTVAVSVSGVHMDPNLYPEPDKFIPERFTREEGKARPGHYFLGFGAGPRNCIGMRFSMVSIKLAMITLLRNYKFSPCAKTETPLKFSKRSMVLKAENGIWVKMEKI